MEHPPPGAAVASEATPAAELLFLHPWFWENYRLQTPRASVPLGCRRLEERGWGPASAPEQLVPRGRHYRSDGNSCGKCCVVLHLLLRQARGAPR